MRELGLLVLTLSVLSTPLLQSSAPDCYAAQGDKVCIVTGSTLHIFGDCGAKAMDSVDLTSSTSHSRVSRLALWRRASDTRLLYVFDFATVTSARINCVAWSACCQFLTLGDNSGCVHILHAESCQSILSHVVAKPSSVLGQPAFHRLMLHSRYVAPQACWLLRCCSKRI